MTRPPFALPAVVVLVGPSGAGKSTWARERFMPNEVVSSDGLRAVVGESESDLRASRAAFEILDRIVGHRVGRNLTTVIDTVGLDDAHRAAALRRAREAGMRAVAVVFDTPLEVCLERNALRPRPVPRSVVRSQRRRSRDIAARVRAEGWDKMLTVEMPAGDTEEPAAPAPPSGARRLRFGIVMGRFLPVHRDNVAAIGRAAEETGFESVWVMDHVVQIPQVGREWEDVLESHTTLAYLAAVTRAPRLGAMVTCATFRNLAHLWKIVATLDVLSGGRAVLGIGAGWYEREHRAYGWDFPDAPRRLDLVEDALRLLPMMWGAGSPPFVGRTVSLPETICYPRPLQDRIPILVGGGGERRTLRLAARHADGSNLQGDVDTIRHKIGVLTRHCREVGRDPDDVVKTVLLPMVLGSDRTELRDIVDRIRPPSRTIAEHLGVVGGTTAADLIERCERLFQVGVREIYLSPRDLEGAATVERFAPVVGHFS